MDMCCLGSPKHLARNATTYRLNPRHERSLSVIHIHVLRRNGLSIRRNDRHEIQRHRASIPSIRLSPNQLQVGSYWLKHVEYTQRYIKIRHIVSFEPLEISQKNSSDRPVECPNQSSLLNANAKLQPQAKSPKASITPLRHVSAPRTREKSGRKSRAYAYASRNVRAGSRLDDEKLES